MQQSPGKVQHPIPSLASGQGGSIEGPAGPLWGRTSEQTGGPGGQAAENRPWECLTVHDSAEPGGGGGGRWSQQLPWGIWPFSPRRGHLPMCPHPCLSTLRRGPGGEGTGCPQGWWGGSQSKCHRKQRKRVQGCCPARAAGLCQWVRMAGPGRGADPSGVTGSQALGAQHCLEVHLGPLWDRPAGPRPSWLPSGSPAKPGWCINRQGHGRRGEQMEVVSANAPRTRSCFPQDSGLGGALVLSRCNTGCCGRRGGLGQATGLLCVPVLTTLPLVLQTQAPCLLAALGGKVGGRLHLGTC